MGPTADRECCTAAGYNRGCCRFGSHMIHQAIPAHPGLTAIAAVLALTATPALAQLAAPDPSALQAQPAAEPSAPVSADPAGSAPVKTVQSLPPPTPKMPDLPVAVAEEPAQAAADSEPAKPTPIKKASSAARSAKPVLSMPAFTPAPSTVAAGDSKSPVMPAQSEATTPVPIVYSPTSSADMAPISDNPVTETSWLLLGGGLLVAMAGTVLVISRRRRPRSASPARPAERMRSLTPVPAAPASAPMKANARSANRQENDHAPILEALIAQPPSRANPFSTRRNRLRRAHYLLRTGQARAEFPAATSVTADRPAPFAPDRWSETRIAGQTPMWVNWQPAKR